MTHPSFVVTDEMAHRLLISQRPLATVVSCHSDVVSNKNNDDTSNASRFLCTHVPLYVEVLASGEWILKGHMSRGNPHVAAVVNSEGGSSDVLVVFRGDDGYISPSFYPQKRVDGAVVPTWDYVVLECRGTLRVMMDDARYKEEVVSTLTDQQEERYASYGEAKVWHVSDAPRPYVQSLLNGIVGIDILVTSRVGRWKLSQNRSSEEIAGTVAGLEARCDYCLADAVRDCATQMTAGRPPSCPPPSSRRDSTLSYRVVTAAAVGVILGYLIAKKV